MRRLFCISLTLLGFLFVTPLAISDEIKGLNARKSLPYGFKSHGAKWVTKSSTVPVREGNQSLRFEVRPGDCGRNDEWNDCKNDRERHEYTTKSLTGTHWHGWSMFVPDDFENVYPTKVALGQFHLTGRHPPAFMFQNGSGGLQVDPQIVLNAGKGPLIKPNEFRGRWIDFVVWANWTTKDDGFFRVYLNGESKPRFAWTGRTLKPGTKAYFKFGIYRTYISRYRKGPVPKQVVFYDEISSGKKCPVATKYFDCQEILETAITLPTKSQTCGGELCKPSYDRSREGLEARFECLLEYASANNVENIPTQEQIETVIDGLVDVPHYRSPGRLRKLGMPKRVVSDLKVALTRLVNHTGSVEEFCARPVP